MNVDRVIQLQIKFFELKSLPGYLANKVSNISGNKANISTKESNSNKSKKNVKGPSIY